MDRRLSLGEDYIANHASSLRFVAGNHSYYYDITPIAMLSLPPPTTQSVVCSAVTTASLSQPTPYAQCVQCHKNLKFASLKS